MDSDSLFARKPSRECGHQGCLPGCSRRIPCPGKDRVRKRSQEPADVRRGRIKGAETQRRPGPRPTLPGSPFHKNKILEIMFYGRVDIKTNIILAGLKMKTFSLTLNSSYFVF